MANGESRKVQLVSRAQGIGDHRRDRELERASPEGLMEDWQLAISN